MALDFFNPKSLQIEEMNPFEVLQEKNEDELDKTRDQALDQNIFELTDKDHFLEFQEQMLGLEQDLTRELRIKTRKIRKHEIQLKEVVEAYRELHDEIQSIIKPNSVRKMIKEELVQKLKKELKDQKDDFDVILKNHLTKKMTKEEAENSLLKDMENESMLYLSSNWSTGILDYVPICASSRMSNKEFREPNNGNVFTLPKFDIQKAIDYPRSDFDSSSDHGGPTSKEQTAQQLKDVENRIDQILVTGGVDIDSQGSFRGLDNLSQESDLVPVSSSLAQELDAPARVSRLNKELETDNYNSNKKLAVPVPPT